ncbi:hypothetical protein UFOVP612_45 [uncultured Caudovirales phage]|uniref:Uncharacterized protein n=1 Tax=uncultured Caudovirales phage TaxID=2100421 RepID=A0A6J5N241_9CAUD|nr:hypothetical protein UFOVP612_45 [uncultured Caudovirales phage]
MWILPKQLHTSAYVPDMEALISDLAEQSQICEPSLLARSKPSLARTWSQRWKRDSWTQHLSGRILKPSHGQNFVTAWTSSLEVIHVSRSQQQGNDSEQKIHDTSGHLSQPELFPCVQESASSRTSRDTSALDSEKSLANWKALVTRLRGAYSLRVKSAHLTNGNESLSWPTAKARDWKDTMGCSLDATNPDGTHRNRRDRLVGAIVAEMHGQAVPVSPSTDGNRQESSQEGRLWMTPKSGQCGMTATTSGRPLEKATQLTTQVYVVNRQESWATPSTMDHINVVRNPEERSPAANKGGIPLGDQARRAEQWATPRLGREEKAETRLARGKDIGLHGQVGAMTNSAKLNPRWVEALMGLPIGWTMPSCSSPLTIAQTNSDCLATELCQPPQPELF